MKNYIIIILFLLNTLYGYTQNKTENEIIILTIEVETDFDSYGPSIYYWIMEFKGQEYDDNNKKPEFYPLFLDEFYGSDQLESCCLGEVSDPFALTTKTKFDFPEDYSAYLSELRKSVKKNRQRIQTIKKEWDVVDDKEKITVYATFALGNICKCAFGGDKILKKGDFISFPKENYIFKEKNRLVENLPLFLKDFSDFNYYNKE